MNESRTVVDTGVVLSAMLFPHSVPRQAFDLATDGTLLLSADTIAELDDVFRRPKFDKYWDEAARLEFLAALVRDAEEVEVHGRTHACRDPKDDKFLELAVAGEADFIVSGDQDLLVLNPFRDIPILTPAEYLERNRAS